MYLCTQTASVALGLKLTAGSGEKKYFLCGVPVLFPEVRPHCGGAPQVVAFFVWFGFGAEALPACCNGGERIEQRILLCAPPLPPSPGSASLKKQYRAQLK